MGGLDNKLFLFFCFISSYKKTHETLSHAGQKATAAFSNVGTAISKKFGPDWASLELSPSVESRGCGLGPSPVRLG